MEIEKLSKKYHGDMAETYDELRIGTPQWESEQRVVEDLLSHLDPGTSILDVPVGTGRFMQAYATAALSVTAVDASSSMLGKAKEKAGSYGLSPTMLEASIDALDFPDEAFDVTVCIRFMDWVDTAFLRRAFAELARVTRKTIIVSVPTYTPLSAIAPFSWSGFMRMMRQWKFRFYKIRTRSDAVVHSQRNLREVFHELGLTIGEVFPVDPPSSPVWRRGEERNIYVLKKEQA